MTLDIPCNIWGMCNMAQLKLLLMGPPRLEFQGQTIDFRLRKALALIVYLAVTKEEHSRDELAALLWPESDQSGARASLRRTLYHINKTIGEEILLTGKEVINLNPQIDIWTDIDQFTAHLRDVSEEVESDEIKILEEAVAYYRGDLLSGFSLPDSPRFDEWQFFETETLRRSLVTSLSQLVSAYESQGEFEKAINHARSWLSLDVLEESAHRRLMKLYASAGQHLAALRQYQECERILDKELNVSPQPKTVELYENIRLRRGIEKPTIKKRKPEVKFVPSGDVHIAYVEIGDGPVDILWVCGFINHLEHFWELPEVEDFFEMMSSFSRVIVFDRRGVGLSDRVGYLPTLEDTLEDVLAVMRATDSKRPVLLGYLEGGPNSMLFAATYPKQVSGLILYGTCAKWAYSEDYPWAITLEQFDRWEKYMADNWGEALNLDTYTPNHAHEARMQEWWAKMMRLASSPGGMRAVLSVMREIDVREILPAIHIPTLILQRKGDRATRVGSGRYLAGQIPGAKYIELEGDEHWFFFGDSQSILREIQTFIHELESPVFPERMLATIALIDSLNGPSSEKLEESKLIQDDTIYALIHREITRFHGSEVSWNQSRYLATFDGPSRAIRCVKSIIESAGQQNLNLRASLHTGEVEYQAGEIVGTVVQIAEGILNNASGCDVLTSSTVKDLVVGSGIEFVESGQVKIEGIPGKWEIFRVK